MLNDEMLDFILERTRADIAILESFIEDDCFEYDITNVLKTLRELENELTMLARPSEY